MRWTLMGVIGFLTGIVAFLIDISVKYLFQLKYGLLEQGTSICMRLSNQTQGILSTIFTHWTRNLSTLLNFVVNSELYLTDHI